MDFRAYERLGRYVAVTERAGDGDLRLLHISRDLAELVGRPARELVGGSTFALGANHDTRRRMHIDRALEQNGGHRGQAGVVTHNGVVPAGYVYRRDGELHVAVVEPLLDVEEWLTQSEAARYVRRSERAIRRARLDGELLAGGTAHAPRFKRSWLDDWLLHSPIPPLLVLALVALATFFADLAELPTPF